ncbi:MAG: c-type cytochrome [candidate division NC10 bacterium]|nr:c-type cytochrome [candidate division NC10 bacterium]MBI2115370.1 c-type cytochrome [candidate division NC10 bacterium]MBI2457419.1 c-type cytochrome [candidate division NC10 bacterium]
MRVALAAVMLLLVWQGSVGTIQSSNAPAGSQASREVLRHGRDVYMANCAVCHGETGDGNGMAAHMFRIRPRDFRRGLLKFRSTPSGSLPTDEDLLQTVTQGIRWTGMVGRSDLPEADRKAVVQYLKTFSPRFASERRTLPVALPPAPPKSGDLVVEGRRLYRDADCAKCHGDRGIGDGPSAPGMKDDWGWPIRPSDLTWRPLKRGSAPAEIYLTIATGLSGTPMPSYGDSLDSQEIWALVSYLESLVSIEHRLSPLRHLGEEQAGWMVVRMHGMMGPGMMGPDMMRRMPMMR